MSGQSYCDSATALEHRQEEAEKPKGKKRAKGKAPAKSKKSGDGGDDDDDGAEDEEESEEAKREYKTRVPDKAIEAFGGKLVNTKALCKLLGCRPESVTRMIAQRDGLPHIRIGARNWFDPEAVFEWFKKQEVQKNPTKRNKR